MATIHVDGRSCTADPAQNLLHALLTLGFDLPYFCWHPVLHSVGACRQCAIKSYRDEKDAKGRIVMACLTPVTEGARVSIADPEAVAFRAMVIEGLMQNHPHDCPVCDEGGECHLQDMTVMTGHAYRRYRFPKRTFRNQDLGPFVNHEMNRCIQCYRCVRFYRDTAGGRDLHAFLLRDRVFFGRAADGPLESEFSGNLVEICPTGVFTDKTLRFHYARKWDLTSAPSLCVHCGTGCNVAPGERYGMLRRVQNRFHAEVNGYFLCDRGRYGYGFVGAPRRLRAVSVDGAPAAAAAAVERVAARLAAGGAVGIGSPRASLEANFALRALVGPERFFAGLAARDAGPARAMLECLRAGPARSPSVREIAACDAVLVLGEDVADTAPRVALALRESVLQQPLERIAGLRIPRWLDQPVREAIGDDRGPLFVLTPAASRLDAIATEVRRAAPDDIARFGFAVAAALGGGPAPGDLAAPEREAAGRVADALRGAQRPLVLSGPSLASEPVVRAAHAIAGALCSAGRAAALSYAVPECDSVGLAWLDAPPLEAAARALREGPGRTLIVLENDLYRRAPAAEVDALLAAAAEVVVLDVLETPTSARGTVVLPAAAFAEADGTLINAEGRAQRFFQVLAPGGEVRESWRWLRDLRAAAGGAGAAAWESLDDVLAAMAAALPELAPARDAAPSAGFRIAGARIPRQPPRWSGRTAVTAHVAVSEPAPPLDPDAPFTFTMEGTTAQPPAPLVPWFWRPGWNSIQALNKYQEEIGGPLRGGPAGVRLIEPGPGPGPGPAAAAPAVPRAFAPRAGERLAVPLFHVFGSDETSLASPPIAQRAPAPYVAMRPEDAAALGIADGDAVTVRLAGAALRLPARIRPDLAPGLAGLPAGLPPLAGLPLPAWVALEPAP